MNQTLVAAFDSHEAAERAAEELTRLGFARDEIQIQTTRTTTRHATSSGDRADDGEGEGVLASIRHFFAELFGDDEEVRYAGHYTEAVRRGGAVLTVVTDDTRLDVARQALTAAGAVDVDERAAQWRSQGWTGDEQRAEPSSSATASTEDDRAASAGAHAARERGGEAVLPVVHEEIEVGKRRVGGGAVRVVSRVVSRPVSQAVELRREEAVVERRAVDREASPADAQAFQERTIEIEEMAERPVVHKTAHVVEEVVVGKRVSTETERIEDTVRRTEVDVERVGAREGSGRGSEGGSSVTGAVSGGRRDFAEVEDEFRSDYRTNLAHGGGSYEDYRPAYRDGYELRGDARYADRDWDDVEPELRDRWQREHPESAWERIKAAVRRGWERATT